MARERNGVAQHEPAPPPLHKRDKEWAARVRRGAHQLWECGRCGRAFTDGLVFDGPAHADAPRGICPTCEGR